MRAQLGVAEMTLLAAIVPAVPSGAQPGPADFEYAVKLVCGRSDGGLTAPGQYFTTVNVHNPAASPVRFRKRAAIALAGQRAGRAGRRHQDLRRDTGEAG